jgi:hypothetical protein
MDPPASDTYVVLIPEAVQFVLTLARNVTRLSGRVPDKEIPVDQILRIVSETPPSATAMEHNLWELERRAAASESARGHSTAHRPGSRVFDPRSFTP